MHNYLFTVHQDIRVIPALLIGQQSLSDLGRGNHASRKPSVG
jgi:hypothetical protein